MTLLLIIFIICDVAGIPSLVPNIMFRSAYEVCLPNLYARLIAAFIDHISTNGIWRDTLVLMYPLGLQQSTKAVGAKPEETTLTRRLPIEHKVNQLEI